MFTMIHFMGSSDLTVSRALETSAPAYKTELWGLGKAGVRGGGYLFEGVVVHDFERATVHLGETVCFVVSL
jgi:hypothetical protein